MGLRLDQVVIRSGGFEMTADLEVERGARVAVLGPSGAGKSTLLAAIAGFLTPVRGNIFVDSQRLTDLPPGERPVATLFQDGNLFPHLSVAKNVALGLRSDLKLSAQDWQTVTQALERVGLSGMGARKPAALSGGQQSRAALARVLLQNREIILLDEPFAALGPALKIEMLDLVAEVVREAGATVLMVSHDPEDARRITDQVILVADGVAHPPQGTQALLADPPPALRAYLG